MKTAVIRDYKQKIGNRSTYVLLFDNEARLRFGQKARFGTEFARVDDPIKGRRCFKCNENDRLAKNCTHIIKQRQIKNLV